MTAPVDLRTLAHLQARCVTLVPGNSTLLHKRGFWRWQQDGNGHGRRDDRGMRSSASDNREASQDAGAQRFGGLAVEEGVQYGRIIGHTGQKGSIREKGWPITAVEQWGRHLPQVFEKSREYMFLQCYHASTGLHC